MHVIKNKTQKIVSICIFLVFASLVTLVRYNQNLSLGKYQSFTIDENVKRADITTYFNLTGGAGIYIDDSDPFNDWSTNEASYDWISGAGTLGNPYEIVNVLFDGEDRDIINLITIKNSIAHFRIESCILYNTNANYWNEHQGNGIYLENVENGIISNVDTSFCANGIRLVNSNNTRIQGIFASGNRKTGITVSGGSTNIIRNNVANINSQGIIISGCSAIKVTNNHLRENGKVEPSLFLATTQSGDTGIGIVGSTYINVTGNILDSNGIGVSGGHNNMLILNEITGFGYIVGNSYDNIISGNLITGALIAIDLHSSSYNNINLNVIVSQQCFRERGICTANIFEDNDCTEVLPAFYLREIVSIIGIASVLGINIPLFLIRRKKRK